MAACAVGGVGATATATTAVAARAQAPVATASNSATSAAGRARAPHRHRLQEENPPASSTFEFTEKAPAQRAKDTRRDKNGTATPPDTAATEFQCHRHAAASAGNDRGPRASGGSLGSGRRKRPQARARGRRAAGEGGGGAESNSERRGAP